MMNMKGIVVLVATVVLVGASPAHAGKRLTTGSSGVSNHIECTVVNVSDAKTITVDIVIRNTAGTVVGQSLGVVLPPLKGTFSTSAGSDRWCEFVVVSGGSAKDLRGSMVVYDSSVITAIEPARAK